MSLKLNLGCIIVAAVAACLITVDLVLWRPENTHYLQVCQVSTDIYIYIYIHVCTLWFSCLITFYIKTMTFFFPQMELLELIVLGLEVFLSAVLCIWFSKAKGSKAGWCIQHFCTLDKQSVVQCKNEADQLPLPLSPAAFELWLFILFELIFEMQSAPAVVSHHPS